MVYQPELDDLEMRYLMELVPKYYFNVKSKPGHALIYLNTSIRKWLGENCASTWETRLEGRPHDSIGVYFDLDSEPSDILGFKLQWL